MELLEQLFGPRGKNHIIAEGTLEKTLNFNANSIEMIRILHFRVFCNLIVVF